MPQGEDWLDLAIVTLIFFVGIAGAGVIAGWLTNEGWPPSLFYAIGLCISFGLAVLTFALKDS
jgi:hypothetical protein